jgi:hypothetical protein
MYALKYALAPNPDYPQDEENDCTNFVSQALLSGGWTMVGGASDGSDRKSETVWWYGKRKGLFLGKNWSWTWANAAFFSKFLEHSGRGTRVADPMELGLGDVVQIANASRVHHTMIVTGKTATDLKLSYHSTPQLNIALSEVKQRASGENFLYWRLSDTNC